ncbi:MAG: DUF933 domain-containing protein [Candidatus Aminicenantes bacterium]|nr:DUF933 domain-containing protein [Candidatus Aminicenantes bacterium]
MLMILTIFGYPKTGKTTLFNLLSGTKGEIGAHKELKDSLHQRTISIPDPRLDQLSALYPEKRKIEATVEIVDLPGVAYGDIKAGKTLATLRRANGLLHVVRAFESTQLPYLRGEIDPLKDISFMEEELMVADLIVIENRLGKIEKELKRGSPTELHQEKELLLKLQAGLMEGQPIRTFTLTPQEEKTVRSYAFLSQKPLLHLINVDEKRLKTANSWLFKEKISSPFLIFAGLIESEIAQLDPEDRKAFLEEYGCGCGCQAAFFSLLPQWLNLIFFFTIGKDEVRAWPLPKNTPAQRAAGYIHSDMEKGFIRAEVVALESLLAYGSLQAVKEKGELRLEGKDYLIRDGDVVTFRFTS